MQTALPGCMLLMVFTLCASAQSNLCDELSQAVRYAKNDFSSIKGAQSSGSDMPNMFDSTFSIASVDSDCSLVCSDDQPRALGLICSKSYYAPRHMSAEEAEQGSEAFFNALTRDVKGCVSERFPAAQFGTLRNNSGREDISATGFGQSANGFDIEIRVEHRCRSAHDVESCYVNLDVDLESQE